MPKIYPNLKILANNICGSIFPFEIKFGENMFRKLYDWMMEKAEHDKAGHALAAVSFAESSVFPIPPDVMLIPMVLARRARAWFYAGIATISSVLGGIAGYAVGYFLFATVGVAILNFYGYMGKFDSFSSRYNEYGAWIVLFAGVTPFPFKVITIASGVTKLSFPLFVASSLFARALRFFIVAGLLYWLGPTIRGFIERYFGLLTFLFFLLLFGGFALVKYLP
jgi:membrane protein YqaA with SNARE-associated domain